MSNYLINFIGDDIMSWCSTKIDYPPPEYKNGEFGKNRESEKIGLQITYYNKSLETSEDNKKSSWGSYNDLIGEENF